MTAGILGFIFKDWIKEQATSGFQAFIVHYRDDPDQQNLIDWIQEGWVSFQSVWKTYVARLFQNMPISHSYNVAELKVHKIGIRTYTSIARLLP